MYCPALKLHRVHSLHSRASKIHGLPQNVPCKITNDICPVAFMSLSRISQNEAAHVKSCKLSNTWTE